MSQSGKRDEVLALWRGIGEKQGEAVTAKQRHPCVQWYIDGLTRTPSATLASIGTSMG